LVIVLSNIFKLSKQQFSDATSPVGDKSSIISAKKPDNILFESLPQKESVTFSEDIDRDIERSQARTLSRMGERIFGLPGDIQYFIKSMLPEKTQFLAGVPLPTSEKLKEKSEKLSLGYTKPITEFEEKMDEFAGDVAGMMIPGGPGYTISRTIGIPLVGALTKEAAGDYGDPTKAGVMLALDLIGGKKAQIPGKKGAFGGVQKYVSSLFQEAENSLPQGQNFVDVAPMVSNLKNLKQDLLKGGAHPSTKEALTKVDELLSASQSGYMDVHQFPAFRKSINEIRDSLGGFGFEMPKKIKGKAIANLEKVKREVIDAGERYGSQMNPEFLKNWREANQAQAILSKSNVVGNFIQKTIGKHLLHPVTKSLLGIGGVGASAIFKPAILAGSTGAFGMYEAGKTLYRVIESPALRKFYTKALEAAINGQKSALASNVVKLDKKIKEEEKEKEKIKKELFK